MAATNLTSPSITIRVRRVNKLPILIGLGVVATLIAAYFVVLLNHRKPSYDSSYHSTYSRQEKLYTPTETAPVAPVPPPHVAQVDTTPPPTAAAPVQDDMDKLEREHQKKLKTAKWDMQAKATEASFSRSQKLIDKRNEERLAALRSSALVSVGNGTQGQGSPAAGSVAGPVMVGAQNGVAQQGFPQQQLNQQPVQEQASTISSSYLVAPTSPWILKSGTRIPATLEQWVSSDAQEGIWVAIVTTDIFDSIHSRDILIPAGSSVVGMSEVELPTNGQPLLLLSARTLHLLDGRTLNLGRTMSQDGTGVQGLTDIVNRHLWQKWGSAAALSLITAGIRMASFQSGGSNGQYFLSPSDAAAAGTGQILGQAAGEELRKKMAIRPTVILEAGYPLNLTLTQDYAFQGPYQPQELPQ